MFVVHLNQTICASPCSGNVRGAVGTTGGWPRLFLHLQTEKDRVMASTVEENEAIEWPSVGTMTRGQIGMTLGAVGAGILIGLATSLGRRVAVQAASGGMNRDWDEVLQLEHRAVEDLFQKMLATDDRETGKRTALLAKIKHGLMKHAMEEENAIYPALQRIDAQQSEDELFRDHAEIKKALYDLDRMDKSDAVFLSRVTELQTLIERHVREEEGDLFPRLKRSMTAEETKLANARVWREGLKLA
jgi:hemerythrin superfamily protein